MRGRIVEDVLDYLGHYGDHIDPTVRVMRARKQLGSMLRATNFCRLRINLTDFTSFAIHNLTAKAVYTPKSHLTVPVNAG